MKQFFIILLVVLIIQIPGWILILGRDSGQINDFGNEGWIMIYEWGATLFSFPIYYFLSDNINIGIASIIYLLDLVLMSLIFHFIQYGMRTLYRKIVERRLISL